MTTLSYTPADGGGVNTYHLHPKRIGPDNNVWLGPERCGIVRVMKIRVSVDANLLAAAKAAGGFRTNLATVEYALWTVIWLKSPEDALAWRDTVRWCREVEIRFREEFS
jgi:hypothetical protein